MDVNMANNWQILDFRLRKNNNVPRNLQSNIANLESFLHDRIVSIAEQLGTHGLGVLDVSKGADLNMKKFVVWQARRY